MTPPKYYEKSAILRKFCETVRKRVAILDLGTNTFHLLIAEVGEEGFSIIYKEKIAVKIGKGGINNKMITPEATQRALDAIHAFAGIIKHLNVIQIRATATSAIRNASNGAELIRKIKQQTGIDIIQISGSEEAEYIYYGVRWAINLGDKPSLIMDIGGGSVEFIIANTEEIFWKQSFEIGAQRLVDQFHKNDPITEQEKDSIYKYLSKQLKPLLKNLNKFNPETLVGSSGTFDTLSDIYCARKKKERSPNDTEGPFEFIYFYELYNELIHKTRAERMEIPGMVEMRVEMIVVAVILINFILENHNFTNIRVSTFALKEGVLFKFLNEDGRPTL